jgi:hypothetical protein
MGNHGFLPVTGNLTTTTKDYTIQRYHDPKRQGFGKVLQTASETMAISSRMKAVYNFKAPGN